MLSKKPSVPQNTLNAVLRAPDTRTIDQHGVHEELRQAHAGILGKLPHLLRERPPNRHSDHLSVYTLPRTARRVRLCRHFGGRLEVGLALLR